MEWLLGIGVVVSMVALRLAVPLALTVAFVHLIRRLDARWHPAAGTLTTA